VDASLPADGKAKQGRTLEPIATKPARARRELTGVVSFSTGTSSYWERV